MTKAVRLDVVSQDAGLDFGEQELKFVYPSCSIPDAIETRLRPNVLDLYVARSAFFMRVCTSGVFASLEAAPILAVHFGVGKEILNSFCQVQLLQHGLDRSLRVLH